MAVGSSVPRYYGSKLPSAAKIKGWSREKSVNTLRHIPDNPE
jgi:hypothetical protein